MENEQTVTYDGSTVRSANPNIDRLITATASSKQHIKLRVWIPSEQAGFIIGKKGDSVQKLQRDSGVKHINLPQLETDGAWTEVRIKGVVSAAFKAYCIVAELVEEVDDVIAEYALYWQKEDWTRKEKLSFAKISADTGVRINIPGWHCSIDSSLQLEGDADKVAQAIMLLIPKLFNSLKKYDNKRNEEDTITQSLYLPSKDIHLLSGNNQKLIKRIMKVYNVNVIRKDRKNKQKPGGNKNGHDSADVDKEDEKGDSTVVVFSVHGSPKMVEAAIKLMKRAVDKEDVWHELKKHDCNDAIEKDEKPNKKIKEDKRGNPKQEENVHDDEATSEQKKDKIVREKNIKKQTKPSKQKPNDEANHAKKDFAPRKKGVYRPKSVSKENESSATS